MKILIINGSPRKQGATARILNELCQNLTAYPDVTIELVHLSDLPMHFCVGCCSCYQTGQCMYLHK